MLRPELTALCSCGVAEFPQLRTWRDVAVQNPEALSHRFAGRCLNSGPDLEDVVSSSHFVMAEQGGGRGIAGASLCRG